MNAWEPYLEGIALGDLRASTIEDALQRMLETDGTITVLKRYVVLNMVLTHALKTGEIAENPMQHIPRPKPSPSMPNAILGDELERLKARLPQLPLKPWVVGGDALPLCRAESGGSLRVDARGHRPGRKGRLGEAGHRLRQRWCLCRASEEQEATGFPHLPPSR